MLEEYYRENKQKHVNFLRKKVRPSYYAEDIVQEAFIKAIKYFKNFDENRGNLNSWFSKILFRTYLDFICNKKEFMDVFDIEDSKDYNAIIEDKLTILSLINNYNEKYKELLTLFYIKDYNIKEVHEALHISETMIRQICYRFRNSVKKEWGIEV